MSPPKLRGGAVAVETFVCDWQMQITLPLDKQEGEFHTRPAPLIITTIDFTPGSVTFQGQPIDFDGTEANFLATSYTYQYQLPAIAGPAIVPVHGGFQCGPVVCNPPGNGGVDIRQLELGPGFSAANLDVVPGQSTNHGTGVDDWQSPVIPELNGVRVFIDCFAQIDVVDPVTGNLAGTGDCVIVAFGCAGDFDGDGMVGISDLLMLLARWGPCGGCAQDLDLDGSVGIGDLLLLLAAWGPCS